MPDITVSSDIHAFMQATDKAAMRTAMDLTSLATMATSGTPSGSNFLRGDGAWATPSAGTTEVIFAESHMGYYATTAISGMMGTAASSGTATNAAGESGHPGVWTMSDSTTANGGFRFVSNTTAILISGGERHTAIFKPVSAATTVSVRTGYSDSFTNTAPTNGVWINMVGDGTGWTISGKTRNNSSESTTGTTYTAAVSTWYRGTIEINAGATLVTYALYNDAGTQLWTDTLATNIPTATGRETGYGFGMWESTVDAAAIRVSWDYVKYSRVT